MGTMNWIPIRLDGRNRGFICKGCGRKVDNEWHEGPHPDQCHCVGNKHIKVASDLYRENYDKIKWRK